MATLTTQVLTNIATWGLCKTAARFGTDPRDPTRGKTTVSHPGGLSGDSSVTARALGNSAILARTFNKASVALELCELFLL